MSADDLLRQRETKTRLMVSGWVFSDSIAEVDEGHMFICDARHEDHGGQACGAYDYDEAVADAIQYASHAQARAGAPRLRKVER